MRVHRDPAFAEILDGKQRIVVLAPHPDDESLGCGALLARAFAGAGAGAHVICMTDGSASHPGSAKWPADRLAQLRRVELIRAIALLGGTASDLTWLGLADGKLHQSDPVKVAADLATHIAASGARYVFAPAIEDHHEDHKATARIAQEVRRRNPDWTFYSYPVWSRWDDIDFDQNVARHDPVFLEPGDCRDQKRAAILAHKSQLGQIVNDDPNGFVLPAGFVDKFGAADEVFWRMP